MSTTTGAVRVGAGARLVPASRAQPVRAAVFGPQRQINVKPGQQQLKQRQLTVAQAQSSPGQDFDSILADIADKFEKSDKKAAIIGYSAAAAGAFFFSEWLIHLPLLNVLLGFPIQLIGLLLLPYVIVKYGLDGDDYIVDIKGASNRVVKKLPGFEK